MEPYPTYFLKHYYCEALQNMLYPLRWAFHLFIIFFKAYIFSHAFSNDTAQLVSWEFFLIKKKKSARVFTHFKTQPWALPELVGPMPMLSSTLCEPLFR